MLAYAGSGDKQFGTVFVGVLEVEVGGDEVVLHHQHRVDDLARASHPHLVSGLRLGAGNLRALVAEHIVNSLCLVGVAHVGGGSVCVDIAYLADVNACALYRHAERLARTIHIRRGYMVAVGGESVA